MRHNSVAKHPINPISNQSGSAVTIILGLLLTIGVVSHVAITASSDYTVALKDKRITAVRDALVAQLRTYSSIGATFRSSLSNQLPASLNQLLYNCVFESAPSPCIGGGIEQPVTLYYPTVALDGKLRLLAGAGPESANSKPARFDITGAPCADDVLVATPACPFEVYATFVAVCAGGAPTCATAESISVRYIVKVAQSLDADGTYKIPVLAPIDRFAPSVARSSILPSPAGSSSNNVMVTVLRVTEVAPTQTSTETPSTTTTVKPPAPTPDPAIVAAIKAGGVKKTKVINNLALAFASAGYSDPDFISAVSKAGSSQWNDGSYTKIISAIGAAGITEISEASFIAKAGIDDASWARIVIESKITNAEIAGALQDSDIKTPEKLAAVTAAIRNLPVGKISIEIADSGIDDESVATQIYEAASKITDTDIAVEIIRSGVTDPTLITSISTAVSGIKNQDLAEALASKKVTDPVLAQTLESIVAPIGDSEDAAEIAIKGLKDTSIAEKLVSEYLIKQAKREAKKAAEQASSSGSSSSGSSTSGSSSNSGTGSSSTTTVTTTAPATTTVVSQPLPEVLLLAPCAGNQCGIPTY